MRYPADELYAVLCIESHRHRTEVVGEDLGTVPAEVREGMAEHAIRRMWVVPFELNVEQAELSEPPANSVASLVTHDLPPFKGFLEGRDLRTRPAAERDARAEWSAALGAALGVGEAPAETLLPAALERLAASSARLVLLGLEDLWLETEPHNQPGTPSTENWTLKARHPVDGLEELAEVDRLVQTVDRGRRTARPAPARTKRRRNERSPAS